MKTAYLSCRSAAGIGCRGAIMIAAMLGVFSALPAMSATFTVSNINDSGSGSLRQALVDANSDPSTVPHTIAFDASLNGTIQLSSKLPTLAYDMTLDGPGSNKLAIRRNAVAEFRILYCVASALTVNGLTITNGIAEDGGGIYSTGTLTINDSVITGNSAIGEDSYSDGSGPHSASNGSGGGAYSELHLTVTNSTISNNLAQGGTDVVGGQYGGNANGGGLFSISDIVITNSTIAQNTALGGNSTDYQAGDALGGGIYANQMLTITGGTVSSNVAIAGDSIGASPDDAGDAFGGGAFSLNDCTFSNASFVGNQANAGQSASYNGLAGGGALFTNAPNLSMTITNCAFATNSVVGVPGTTNGGQAYGGALAFYTAVVSIHNSSFTGNSASSADAGYSISSALDLYGCHAFVQDCLFAKNDASGDASYAAAIAVGNGGALTLVNSTVADNTSVFQGGGLFSEVDISTVENCIFWGNTGSQIVFMDIGGEGGPLQLGETVPGVTYSIVQGGFAGTGNLTGDPRFRNVATGDYQLLPGSPAIDSANGDSASSGDLPGNPRVDDPSVANTGNGSVIADMGAYEFQPGQLYEQEITLYAGWNLISVPFTPIDSSIAGHFGSETVAYRWNASIQNYEQITTITAGEGFFVYSFEPSAVVMTLYSLNQPTRFERNLLLRWNLVGVAETGYVYFHFTSVIAYYYFDAQNQVYSGTEFMNPGGSWLYSGRGIFIFAFPPVNLEL